MLLSRALAKLTEIATALACAALPVFGLFLLLTLVQRCLAAKPRPWSVPMFLGCLATLAIGGLLTPESRNAVQATLLAAVLGLAEVLARRLPRHHLTAACMLAIGLSLYMFVFTVEVIASC